MTHKSEIIKLIIDGIQERKGKKIAVVDLSHIEGSAADSVREYVQEHAGTKPYNYDGYQNSQWIVIDYGDVFVHIFLPDIREHYNLEELWSDAPISEIPDLD